MRIEVKCRLTSQGEDIPSEFWLESRKIQIRAVLDLWPGADHEYFKVLAEDGIFILRRDTISQCWELTFYSEH